MASIAKSPSFPKGLPYLRTEAEARADRAARLVCPRCRVELEDADEAEGCEDYHCPYIGGVQS